VLEKSDHPLPVDSSLPGQEGRRAQHGVMDGLFDLRLFDDPAQALRITVESGGDDGR